MSAEHLLGQAAVVALFDGFDPRQELHSSSANRRADVMVTYRDQRVVIEVQRSHMALEDMEARTRDWNQDGAAVLWVFTASMIDVTASGEIELKAPARKWASARGWQQCYVVDKQGTVWWIDLQHSRARPISRKMTSVNGRRATLVVDTITRAGGDPLVVGAFAWHNGGQRRSPLGPLVPSWMPFGKSVSVDDTTPSAIAR